MAKRKRIDLLLPPEMIEKIDAKAKEMNGTRTEIIEDAVNLYFQEKPQKQKAAPKAKATTEVPAKIEGSTSAPVATTAPPRRSQFPDGLVGQIAFDKALKEWVPQG